MVLTVKFIGALRHLSGKTKVTVDFDEGLSLKGLLAKLGQNMPELEKSLSGLQSGDSASNALILVNGREISVLEGLETKLSDGDEVVFIPVVHGG